MLVLPMSNDGSNSHQGPVSESGAGDNGDPNDVLSPRVMVKAIPKAVSFVNDPPDVAPRPLLTVRIQEPGTPHGTDASIGIRMSRSDTTVSLDQEKVE